MRYNLVSWLSYNFRCFFLLQLWFIHQGYCLYMCMMLMQIVEKMSGLWNITIRYSSSEVLPFLVKFSLFFRKCIVLTTSSLESSAQCCISDALWDCIGNRRLGCCCQFTNLPTLCWCFCVSCYTCRRFWIRGVAFVFDTWGIPNIHLLYKNATLAYNVYILIL